MLYSQLQRNYSLNLQGNELGDSANALPFVVHLRRGQGWEGASSPRLAQQLCAEAPSPLCCPVPLPAAPRFRNTTETRRVQQSGTSALGL